MKKIDYKVENGKLLRLQIKLNDNIIEKLKIRGDFFIYPETALFKIEQFLLGKNIDNFSDSLDMYLQKEAIKIIGFSAKDLEIAINVNKNI